MARLCLSPFYLYFSVGGCVFVVVLVSLICLVCSVTQLVFSVFYRGNVSICSCRFCVSVGGDEFRIFLDPEPKRFPFDFI